MGSHCPDKVFGKQVLPGTRIVYRLDTFSGGVTLRHMETVSLRELHARTGHWVRRASVAGPIEVTDRGRAIAVLAEPSLLSRVPKPFPRRDRSRMPSSSLDSTRLVAEDRDR